MSTARERSALDERLGEAVRSEPVPAGLAARALARVWAERAAQAERAAAGQAEGAERAAAAQGEPTGQGPRVEPARLPGARGIGGPRGRRWLARAAAGLLLAGGAVGLGTIGAESTGGAARALEAASGAVARAVGLGGPGSSAGGSLGLGPDLTLAGGWTSGLRGSPEGLGFVEWTEPLPAALPLPGGSAARSGLVRDLLGADAADALPHPTLAVACAALGVACAAAGLVGRRERADRGALVGAKGAGPSGAGSSAAGSSAAAVKGPGPAAGVGSGASGPDGGGHSDGGGHGA